MENIFPRGLLSAELSEDDRSHSRLQESDVGHGCGLRPIWVDKSAFTERGAPIREAIRAAGLPHIKKFKSPAKLQAWVDKGSSHSRLEYVLLAGWEAASLCIRVLSASSLSHQFLADSSSLSGKRADEAAPRQSLSGISTTVSGHSVAAPFRGLHVPLVLVNCDGSPVAYRAIMEWVRGDPLAHIRGGGSPLATIAVCRDAEVVRDVLILWKAFKIALVALLASPPPPPLLPLHDFSQRPPERRPSPAVVSPVLPPESNAIAWTPPAMIEWLNALSPSPPASQLAALYPSSALSEEQARTVSRIVHEICAAQPPR